MEISGSNNKNLSSHSSEKSEIIEKKELNGKKIDEAPEDYQINNVDTLHISEEAQQMQVAYSTAGGHPDRPKKRE